MSKNNTKGFVIEWLLLIGLVVFIVYVFGIPYISTNFTPVGPDRILGLFNQSPPSSEPPEEQGVTIAEIIKDPAVYEGLTVTIDGSIQDWVTKNAFVVAQPGTTGLLVIAESDFPNPENVAQEELALGDNSKIEAQGRVVVMTQEEIEQRLQGTVNESFTFAPNQQPVLLSNQITKIN